MKDPYMLYPLTVKALAGEIMAACNDYQARKIDDKKLKELILWYAQSAPDKLFSAKELNPTVKKIIGKRREKIVIVMLDGYQFTLRGR